ncbi:sensor histidine kinase [Hymenobacter properus]|uniref:histidine kinase n=1 Tax=Hymenobacter properus TaxID=2791026 RepID=A0A931FKW6_9BACT|nr:ATP-binding protein [Hymenobacter properus]MBF9141436.1 GHKL domain-containing protein [Hymenobacter properus]MBR7720245.1 GHKL domain-containing protein [Microvirga sp. SRT04]
MFTSITDYFIPAGFTGSLDLRRRVRIIVNTVLLTGLFSINFMLLCWWGDLLPGLYVLLFGVVSFVLLLFGYRAGWYSHVVLGYAFVFVGYLTVAVNSAYQGGYYAATTWWLGLCSVIATFLLGRRAGLIYFGLGLATVLAFWGAEQLHYRFPNQVPAAKAQFWHLDILVGLMLILLVVTLVFDSINAQALQLVEAQNAQLEQSLANLHAAQAQLVQREKMAFLGELTAGIAHELQNPLNFMKNFAEVSTGLVDDIDGPAVPHEPGARLQGEILAGLKQNLREISQHGQRATAIIKGMLEHSRTGTSQRVPTDLNALVEDSLRLAYQGLRAKDKTFRAELNTILAPALPPVAVVPQDLSRVLINLLTNALYAVQQRQRQADSSYRPEVTVQTSAGPGGVEIRVRDNGTGIPDEARAKIFQPFFTTKPTGEGTGLGLSLSHDIIAQGHGGTLSVESQPGNFTEFLISLPLN